MFIWVYLLSTETRHVREFHITVVTQSVFQKELYMQKIMVICALLAVTVTHATAEVKCNKNGAVVTQADGTVLYLGKNCDAAREGGGSGKWWNAASFLGVKIDGNTYMVTEEIDCLPFCENPF